MLRWYLVRAGVPIGLALGAGLALRGPRTVWWDLALTAAVPALAVALLLLAAVEPFVRHVTRSKATAAALVIHVVFLTLIGAVAMLAAALAVPHGDWERLPDPPGEVTAFAGPTCRQLIDDDPGVWAATREGGYLVYHRDPGGWVEAPAIPDTLVGREACRGRVAGSDATPPIAGEVIARWRIDDVGADCGGRRHYALRADGSVWAWSTGVCSIAALMAAVAYLALATGVGLLVGLARLSETVPVPWPVGARAAARP